ncbi:MAG: M23 family metallopeptidase [Nostocaceae cyanobacterium]|nr:M23 family metallopeptidase [Nostocaceae cyanobacterium]
MTQRKNSAQKPMHRLWQRSLIAQSLTCISGLSLLSSGLVVAQTEAPVDNIVPTVEPAGGQRATPTQQEKPASQRTSNNSESETSRPKIRWSERLQRRSSSSIVQRLRQRRQQESTQTTANTPGPSRRASRRRKRPLAEVSQTPKPIRREKPQVEISESTAPTRRRKPTTEVTTPRRRLRLRREKPPVEVSTPEATPSAVVSPLPSVSPTTIASPSPEQTSDSSSAYIDPTDYSIGATGDRQAPLSSEMAAGANNCRTLSPSVQGVTANGCPTPPVAQQQPQQPVASRNNRPHTGEVASWVRKSQTSAVVRINPHASTNLPRVSQTRNINLPPNGNPSVREVNNPPVLSNLPQRRRLGNITTTSTGNLPPSRWTGVTPNRLNAIAANKTGYRGTRLATIPMSPTLYPTTPEVLPQGILNGSEVINTTPQVIALAAPMMDNGNMTPRPSLADYGTIPLPTFNWQPQSPLALSNGSGSGLVFPLSLPSPITSLFGWRMHPITGDRRFHSGADLGAPMGTPVIAAYPGSVEIADFVGGYGLTVVLNHNITQQTLYGHLSQIFVQPGQWVEGGTVIGRVGSTGNSTGPHLHFEVRQLTANGWVAVDPGSQLQSALGQLMQALQTTVQAPISFPQPAEQQSSNQTPVDPNS